MSTIEIAYPELRWNRPAAYSVHEALRISATARGRGAHLRCGSAHLTQNWAGSGLRTYAWTGIEPDAELCAAAKAQPYRSQNNVSAFFAAGGDARLINAPLRLDYSFRHEPLTRTSIRTGSVERIVFEFGHRGNDDLDAVVEEICRIGAPGAIVILVYHGPLEVDAWAVNDTLAPTLRAFRRRMRRSFKAFEKLDPREIGAGENLFAEGLFNLRELTRHFEDDPAHLRREALDGWTARGFFDRIVRKHWGQTKVRRNVRRRLRIFVGKVPDDPTELRLARRA